MSAHQGELVPPTQADRLLQAYSEIQNGRLLIIADFEDEKQMGIFRLEGASNPGRLTRDTALGRPETGAGTLAVTFTSPSETVVVSSPPQSEWFLKRDWRPYDLLMMAVLSPRAGLTLETKVVGGVSGQAVETRTETPLAAGWNFLRFDLAEMGEQVPLDDIQEIRLSLESPASEPVTLHFDDILLAGNRRDFLGDSANQTGGLYVQNAGRHWNVGAGGRFEISFRNGQITRWYQLATDPYRLRNLVRGSSLGPVPVIKEGNDWSRTFVPAANAIQARQRLLEMNPVRVVVECVWQQYSPEGAVQEIFSALYTIYSTGQIFVIVAPSVLAPHSGLAMNLAWNPAAPEVQSHSVDVAAGNGNAQALSFATALLPDCDAALLAVPSPAAGPYQFNVSSDSSTKTTSLIWTDPSGEQPQSHRFHIFLTSKTQLDEAQARARALDYLSGGGVRVEVGHALSAPALRSDGFDPGTGTYRLVTGENRARIVIDGRKQALFSPAFLVDGNSEKEAWVYVNYLIHQPVVREPADSVLVQIPGVVTKNIVVEPLFNTTR